MFHGIANPYVYHPIAGQPRWRRAPSRGGKVVNQVIVNLLAGFIPAHTGERQVVHLSDVRSLGSSPLTRGKACLKCQMLDLAGVHPRSRGGKLCATSQSMSVTEVHPRSRGGKENRATVSMPVTRGSSPLTRGKEIAALQYTTGYGFIPAHAGESATPFSRRVLLTGSSPLTRGKGPRRTQNHLR